MTTAVLAVPVAAVLVLAAAGRIPRRRQSWQPVPELSRADVEFVRLIPYADLPPVPPTRSELAWLADNPVEVWPQSFIDQAIARLEKQL